MAARQRGVALITVMVVVAIVVGVAGSVLRDHYLDIRRAENVLHGNQSIALLLGLESWARELLREDRRNNDTDHEGEPWAQVLYPVDAEGGVVSGRILDQQGRFNLNNLVDGDGIADAVAMEQFRRLLELDGEFDSPASIVEAVVDWLDRDQDPTGLGGREDTDYAVLEPAYRTAGSEMVSPTELLLVEGMDYVAWRRLQPLVTVLPKPDGRPTSVNVNTAPAAVIAATAAVDLAIAEDIVEERKDEPFDTVEQFSARIGDSAGDSTAAAMDQARFTTRSDFFLVESGARFGDVTLNMSHLIERGEDGTRVLARGLENAW